MFLGLYVFAHFFAGLVALPLFNGFRLLITVLIMIMIIMGMNMDVMINHGLVIRSTV